MKMKDIKLIATISGYAVLLIALFIFVGWSVYRQITLGSESSDYKTICIGKSKYGHEYYRANFFGKGFLALNVDDDGKPFKCIVEDKR